MFNRSAHVHKVFSKGRDNTLGRHCANRAQLRRQGASAPTKRDTQREQDKISILRGSQNIPPGHLDSPQDMPVTLFFPQPKNCVHNRFHMEHHGNSNGTRN